MNQARKRARMAQKFEETKTTITSELSNDLSDQNCSDFNRNFTDAAIVGSNDRDREKNFKNSNYASDDISPLQMGDKNGTDDITSNNNQNSIKKEEEGELIDENNVKRIIDKKSVSPSSAVLEERIKKFLKSKTFSSPKTNSSENSPSQPETSQTDSGRNESSKTTDEFDDECAEHLYPNEVDSSNVTGEIIQVSSLCRYSAQMKIHTEFPSNRYQVVYIIVHLSLVHLNSTRGAKI